MRAWKRCTRAARKYRVTPEELPDEHALLATKLRQLADATDIDGLRKQEEKAEAAYMDVAGRLSVRRAAAATSWARRSRRRCRS